jgi:hypothetical protein
MYIHRNQEQTCNENVFYRHSARHILFSVTVDTNFSIVGYNVTVVNQFSTETRYLCRRVYSLINGYLFVGTIRFVGIRIASTMPIGFPEVRMANPHSRTRVENFP